ncbi:MAG: hypothetical protein SPF34_02965 [Helicobacter sp.]|uniref:hypothetical protein n=1 Tax=Helicobacter sp. TaxID=218 RepID=UPI002A91EEF1|nr:hypothetical protein [Helicobacter sp.]MDY5615855.1 hypothetical protein [Helicobacter sp.]
MSYFRFVVYSFAFFILLSFLSLGLIYFYDPMQIFHKSFLKEERFFGEMRLGARAIIRHYNFDSYILGTSMLQNTSAKEANRKLGDNWVNISPAASTTKERGIILNYLFRYQNPKTLIYSLDAFSDEVSTKPNFQLLYDESLLNDFEAYLNDRFIICTLTFSQKEKCIGKENLETLLQWIREEKHQKRLGGFENWIKYNPDIFKQESLKSLPQSKPVEFDLDRIDVSKEQELLETFLLSFIKKYPNTQFHLILPPYSRLHFKINPKAFIERKKITYWLFEQTKDLKNVTIYGFDTLDYADDIENYAGDTIHYNIDMNSLQLDSIQNKKHILTPDNIESYFDIFEQKIQDYDLTPLINIIKDSKILEK